jgi:hypothetical protein
MVLNKAVIQGDLGLGVLKMTQGLVELIIISFRLAAPLYLYSFVRITSHQHSHPVSSLRNWSGHPWIKAGAIYHPGRPFDPSSAPVQAIRLTTTVYK